MTITFWFFPVVGILPTTVLDFTLLSGAVVVTFPVISSAVAVSPFALSSVPPVASYFSASLCLNSNGVPIAGFSPFGLYATNTTFFPSGTIFAGTLIVKSPFIRPAKGIFAVPYSSCV